MSIVVQKYGGTSVGSIERIKAVSQKIISSHKKRTGLVIVVSAMSGETDRLISMANKISKKPSKRETDVLLATGEQTSAALLAMAIEDLGYKAISFLGHQVQINTSMLNTSAKIESIENKKIKNALEENYIVIVAGFQGINRDGDITTLGRGGSDITAVALGVILNAYQVEFYKDVDGIFTANPAICPKAKLIKNISYEEMLELSHSGAKVLHPRSVELARRNNIPLIVRSSFNDNPGSKVTSQEKIMEDALISGIVYDKDQIKFSLKNIPDVPDILGKIFTMIADEEVNIDMIVQNTIHRDHTIELSFTCTSQDLKTAKSAIEKLLEYIPGAEYVLIKNLSKLSMVGAGMKVHCGVAATMFSALSDEGIKIYMINTSEIRISCLIDTKHIDMAIRILHDKFKLA